MANGGPQPIWERVTQRFRDATTGRFMSVSDAAPLLTVGGGAFRDSVGRFVPTRYLGGEVIRESPLGHPSATQVVRRVGVDPESITVRPQDIWNATVTYSFQGGESQTTHASLLKGLQWDQPIAHEALARAIALQQHGDSGEPIEYYDDVIVEEIEWNLRTIYIDGQELGGDYFYFQGV